MDQGGEIGSGLFDLVERYHALGWHRTGSQVDAVTAAWFADELRRRGVSIEVLPEPFDRWVTRSSVRAAGVEVTHLPLQTGWVGDIATSRVEVVDLDPRTGGFPGVVDEPLVAAAARGAEAVLLATRHPNGSLVGINREPERADAPPLPALLVAGRDLDACRRGRLEVELHAHVDPGGQTSAVIGHRGADPAVVLTTPLTGWFGCAGERGTGIAVLLHLVDLLSDVPLCVVGTGGHELGFFGAHRYVAGLQHTPTAPERRASLIVHIGASIAVEEDDESGRRRLASTRVAMTTLDAARAEPVAHALAGARLTLATEASRWIGEANAWNRLDRPLLSISGAGIDFHTPEDTPARATSPAALATAASSIGAAVVAALEAVGERPPTSSSPTPTEAS